MIAKNNIKKYTLFKKPLNIYSSVMNRKQTRYFIYIFNYLDINNEVMLLSDAIIGIMLLSKNIVYENKSLYKLL